MKRQGLVVSIVRLRELIKELEEDRKSFYKDNKIRIPKNQNYIIPIINRKPKCSDTWVLE